jgi:hypothetical protein
MDKNYRTFESDIIERIKKAIVTNMNEASEEMHERIARMLAGKGKCWVPVSLEVVHEHESGLQICSRVQLLNVLDEEILHYGSAFCPSCMKKLLITRADIISAQICIEDKEAHMCGLLGRQNCRCGAVIELEYQSGEWVAGIIEKEAINV